MSKRDSGLGKLLGVLVAAGTVAALAKYIKDYTDFEPADKEDIEDLKADSASVKTAAKRTYVALKEKGDAKEAAGELKDAALNVAKDVSGMAKKAGTETAEAFARLKNRYKEDPQGLKDEIKDNLADMSADIGQKVGAAAGNIVNNIKGEAEDAVEFETAEAAETAEEAAEDLSDLAEAVEDAADAFAEAAGEAAEEASDMLIHEEEEVNENN